MRVIFWDVDGVLNHPKIWGAWSKIGWKFAMDETLVARAAKVCAEVDAKCVLSSTWRLGEGGLTRTIMCLYERGWEDAQDRFIDKTPHFGGEQRGVEIGQWLVDHPEVKEYVIVDDDSDMTTHSKRLVLTDREVGLSEADCVKIKELFSR